MFVANERVSKMCNQNLVLHSFQEKNVTEYKTQEYSSYIYFSKHKCSHKFAKIILVEWKLVNVITGKCNQSHNVITFLTSHFLKFIT